MKTLLITCLAFLITFATARADECMPANDDTMIAEGRLIQRDDAFILKLPAAVCLKGDSDTATWTPVRRSTSIPSTIRCRRACPELVGKDVHVRGSMMGATTQHHKAPIVMQLIEADEI